MRQRVPRPAEPAIARANWADLSRQFEDLPLLRKVLACLGLALMFGGSVWFKLTLRLVDLAWSALLFVAGLGLLAVAVGQEPKGGAQAPPT
ncbi:hypothetical protein [Inhella proteolytica]|uniref:Uncharacterized protein n=1 Tax=Inhella proteolytica TaxID=2795029 RepID=A0A931JB60_9BURK|nr:hypothetical protein [Inhella proteolytica]MBH9579390.1 hypothetical protein [Inhella proteolytica]